MTRSSLLTVSLLVFGCSEEPRRPVAEPRTSVTEKAWSPFETTPSAGAIPFGPSSPKKKAADFDRIKSETTLGELVKVLGEGHIAGGQSFSGCGTINWVCEDGRVLSVSPVTYKPDEIIDVGPRQIGGNGGRGRMWMQDGKQKDVEIPK